MGKSSPLAGSSLSNDTIKCPKSRGEGCDMNADSFDQPSSSSLQLHRLPRARRMWSDLVICQPGKCNNLIPTKPRQRWLNKEAKIWQSIAIIILRAKTQLFSRLQHGAGDTQSSRAFPAPLASCHHCVECDRIGHHGLRNSSLHRATSGCGLWINQTLQRGECLWSDVKTCSKLGPTPCWDPLLSLSLSFRYLCPIRSLAGNEQDSHISSDHAPPDPGCKTQTWFVAELLFSIECQLDP